MTKVIGMVTTGTSAEWKLRKKTHIMTNISIRATTKAKTILLTDVNKNLAILTRTIPPNFGGQSPLSLLSDPPMLSVTRAVPELVTRRITFTMVGRLLPSRPMPHRKLFNLIPVTLFRWRARLEAPSPTRTPLHLTGAPK